MDGIEYNAKTNGINNKTFVLKMKKLKVQKS